MGGSERLYLHLSHATLPEKDVQLVVQPDEFGAFQVDLPMLERSRWVVLVEGEKRDWRLARHVELAGPAPGDAAGRPAAARPTTSRHVSFPRRRESMLNLHSPRRMDSRLRGNDG